MVSFLPVPPRESITPRRKQNFYDFANDVYNYGTELLRFRESVDFEDESSSDQQLIDDELAMLEKLNGFQVEQIDLY